MLPPPPRSTRTATLFPYTTLVRFHSMPRLLAHACTRASASISFAAMAFSAVSPEPTFVKRLVEDSATTRRAPLARSEEHMSELQSLMRISYAVFCLKKKKQHYQTQDNKNTPHT